MIVVLLVFFAAYWIGLSIFCYTQLKRIFKKYRNTLRIETPQKYDAFLRMDFGKWDEKALLRRSYTSFPLRFTGVASFIIFFAVLATIHKYLKLPRSIVEIYRRYYGTFAFKLWIDVEPEFNVEDPIETPIVIANHSTWIDIIYFGCFLKSSLAFVAKKEIAEMPFINAIAVHFLRSILVDRSSTEARNKVKQDILDRVQSFIKNPSESLPICIFPEGTVSNGRSIMEFKNGAFQSLSPITIFALKYESKEFNFGDNETTAVENYILSLCSNCVLKIKKEIIYPKEKETSDEYRERCRKRVAELWGFKIYDVSFKEYFEYERMYNEKLKELKEKKKHEAE